MFECLIHYLSRSLKSGSLNENFSDVISDSKNTTSSTFTVSPTSHLGKFYPEIVKKYMRFILNHLLSVGR